LITLSETFSTFSLYIFSIFSTFCFIIFFPQILETQALTRSQFFLFFYSGHTRSPGTDLQSVLLLFFFYTPHTFFSGLVLQVLAMTVSHFFSQTLCVPTLSSFFPRKLCVPTLSVFRTFYVTLSPPLTNRSH